MGDFSLAMGNLQRLKWDVQRILPEALMPRPNFSEREADERVKHLDNLADRVRLQIRDLKSTLNLIVLRGRGISSMSSRGPHAAARIAFDDQTKAANLLLNEARDLYRLIDDLLTRAGGNATQRAAEIQEHINEIRDVIVSPHELHQALYPSQQTGATLSAAQPQSAQAHPNYPDAAQAATAFLISGWLALRWAANRFKSKPTPAKLKALSESDS